MNQPSGISTIFFETCSSYYERIWTVVFLAALLFLLQFSEKIIFISINFVLNLIGFNIENIMILSLLSIVLVQCFSFVFVSIILLEIALDNYKSTVEAISSGLKKIIPYYWASLLFFLVVASGFLLSVPIIYFVIMIPLFFGSAILSGLTSPLFLFVVFVLFFILFLPGIYFTISLIFFGCTVIAENRSGMEALLASRLYIQEYWWDTFFKLFCLSLILIPFAFLIYSIDTFCNVT